MNIYEKLLSIQTELKCGKTQFNKFGNYYFRNCEDILEAVKPLCAKFKAVLFVSDELTLIQDRYYIKATATLVDAEKPSDQIQVTASAREEEEKKGMDGSQITGASSSYARKYALNGLFAIDDTKDSDTTNDNEEKSKTSKTTATTPAAQKATAQKPPITIKVTDKVGFGKYADKTWGEVYIENKNYFEYLEKNAKDAGFIGQIQKIYAELQADEQKFQLGNVAANIENTTDFSQVMI